MIKKMFIVFALLFVFVGHSFGDVIDIIPANYPNEYFQVLGMNDANVVVGLQNNNDGLGHIGFIYDNGQFIYKQNGANSTYFTSINNNGILTTSNGNGHAYLYDMNLDQFTELPFNGLPNAYSWFLNKINDNNLVGGNYRTQGDLIPHAIFYHNGSFMTFDYSDYTKGGCNSLNNLGEALISFSSSPTQNDVNVIAQISTNPLSYNITDVFENESIIPFYVDTAKAWVITDSREIYGEYTLNGVLYAFKYNLNTAEFETLFDNTMFDFSQLRAVNNTGSVAGRYSTNDKGFIWTPEPEEIVFDYSPNIFHLITKNNRTRLVTSGWIDGLYINVQEGQTVPVEMTVKYQGIGPNGEDVIINYNASHTVEGMIIRN